MFQTFFLFALFSGCRKTLVLLTYKQSTQRGPASLILITSLLFSGHWKVWISIMGDLLCFALQSSPNLFIENFAQGNITWNRWRSIPHSIQINICHSFVSCFVSSIWYTPQSLMCLLKCYNWNSYMRSKLQAKLSNLFIAQVFFISLKFVNKYYHFLFICNKFNGISHRNCAIAMYLMPHAPILLHRVQQDERKQNT